MEIIILQGGNSTGKTETLKNFTEQELTPAKGYYPAGLWHQLGSDYRDFSEIFNGNCKIGIFTMGDYGRPLIEATDYFEQHGCDIMICACNDRVREQVRLSNKWKNYNLHTIHKTVDRHHQDYSNRKDVNSISQELQNICNRKNTL